MAAKQVEGKEFLLYMGNAHQLMGIVDLIDRLPTELLAVGGDEYIEFTISVAAIRTQVAEWHSRGDTGSFTRVPGLPELNPVSLIRRYLAKCPDESPSPGTAELSFIGDQALRESIRLDISAANKDLTNGEWKGATVLAGSAAEALLLWVLQESGKKHPGSVAGAANTLVGNKTLARQPDPNPEKWDLHEYIEVASELQIIKPDTAIQLKQAKDFRNLIHPGRAQRLGQKCDRGSALAALAAVEFVVRDLTP